jgi:hypothetical protein
MAEVNRQQLKAQVIFTHIKCMGLQQELYRSHFTASPVQGRSEQSMLPQLSLSPQVSQFYSCTETVVDDDLSSYQESDDQPTSLLLHPLPPLGMIGNPIIISNNKDDIESSLSHPSYHEAQSMFTTPCYNFDTKEY